jgi:hypothetical protein
MSSKRYAMLILASYVNFRVGQNKQKNLISRALLFVLKPTILALV